MATRCPISTISYNSEAFLVEKLNAWINSHLIQCYQYICHKGEDGDKDHIHLRIEPNKSLDPMDLTEQLKEYTLNSDKPLGVRPWRPSKESDWVLYALHNADYLLQHGSDGEKLPYAESDLRCSADYDLHTMVVRALATVQHTAPNIAKRLLGGDRPIDLVADGSSPMSVNAISSIIRHEEYFKLSRELDAMSARYHDIRKVYDDLLKALHSNNMDVQITSDGEVFLIRDGLPIK